MTFRSALSRGFCALLLTGCATVRTGDYGSALDARGHALPGATTPLHLKVSARELKDYSSAYFGALVVTFENASSQWIRVKKMGVRFQTGEQNRGVMIPQGDDLESWLSAAQLRYEMRETNDELADEQIGENRGRLVTPGQFPEGHVLAVPFSIPPGLFARRWIVLSTPGASAGIGCVTTLVLEYDVEGDRQERVSLAFRQLGNRSEWQRRECEKPRAHRASTTSSKRSALPAAMSARSLSERPGVSRKRVSG
jgi:hypothetical protein